MAAATSWLARGADHVASRLGFGGAILGSLVLGASGFDAWLGSGSAGWHIRSYGPGIGLDLSVDALAGIFLVLLGLGGAASAAYAFGYVHPEPNSFRPSSQAALLCGFLATMGAVIVADNAVVFLIAWESMSLVSYLLVLSHRDDPDTLSHANFYLFMTHLGTFFLFVAFAAMAATSGGDYSFDAIRGSASRASPLLSTITFVAALVGFGTKAGLVPMHAWLPRAHPAAPSHVSALMSGVMLKMAVFMFIRVTIDLLPAGPPWWGILVLALGALTTFTGILFATVQNDLKRLLAYSSVENIGVVFMGLGLALLFTTYHHPELAALALVAAVLHSLNHMAMKSLLFLAAGAVLHATGTRNMNHLGGLVHRMPATSVLFLVGSLAISALPPLNGFVGEWLLFQSLLAGVTLPETPLLLQVFLPVGAAVFALAGAISVVCFVKAFGTTFLAAPRSEAARNAHEAPRPMVLAMGGLALVCLVPAALAGLVVGSLNEALAPLVGSHAAPRLVSFGVVLQSLSQVRGSLAPTLIFFAVVTLGGLAYAATRRRAGRRAERVEETWLCGHRNFSPRMEYTSTSYSDATRMFFSGLYRTQPTLDRRPGPAPTIVRNVSYRAPDVRPWERPLYDAVVKLVMFSSNRVRRFQSGSIHAYLAYIFVTLLALLLLGVQ